MAKAICGSCGKQIHRHNNRHGRQWLTHFCNGVHSIATRKEASKGKRNK